MYLHSVGKPNWTFCTFFSSCMCKYSVCPFLKRIHSNFSSHKACLQRDASMEDSKYHLRAAATLNLKNNMSTAPQRNVFFRWTDWERSCFKDNSDLIQCRQRRTRSYTQVSTQITNMIIVSNSAITLLMGRQESIMTSIWCSMQTQQAQERMGSMFTYM